MNARKVEEEVETEKWEDEKWEWAGARKGKCVEEFYGNTLEATWAKEMRSGRLIRLRLGIVATGRCWPHP